MVEKSETGKTLPKDIYPESGFRLPLPKRDDMDEEGKRMYDKMASAGGRALAGLRGPLGIDLHNPKLAELEQSLNHYLRFDAGFSGRIRELAILVTAREMDSRFEWAAHEAMALKEGLPRETIDIVKYRKSISGISEVETVIIEFGREMFGKRKVTSETFARALTIFGTKQLVNLVALMACYSAAAAKLCAFDNQIVPDQPILPVP